MLRKFLNDCVSDFINKRVIVSIKIISSDLNYHRSSISLSLKLVCKIWLTRSIQNNLSSTQKCWNLINSPSTWNNSTIRHFLPSEETFSSNPSVSKPSKWNRRNCWNINSRNIVCKLNHSIEHFYCRINESLNCSKHSIKNIYCNISDPWKHISKSFRNFWSHPCKSVNNPS